jgi:hypothetical protein
LNCSDSVVFLNCSDSVVFFVFHCISCTMFWFWAYLMKVILSVPNEGYFERTWWRLFWAYLMKVILSVLDEGYSRNHMSSPPVLIEFVLLRTPYPSGAHEFTTCFW